MNRSRHYIIVAVLIVISTALLFFLFDVIFRPPTPASTQAGPIDSFIRVHFFMIALLFSLIMVIMLYASFVFRRKEGDETDGPHVHGSTALEVGWTIVPTIVVLGFGVAGALILNDLTRPAPNEMVVQVVGRQWSWSFQYPEEENSPSSDVLVLPLNQPVVLEMESEDVLHSFWVPEFRVKQDLVPGRTTRLRITPTQAGEYKVRCAEICGQGHADMRAAVQVVDQAQYAAFIAERQDIADYAALTPAERGELWYGSDDPNGFACSGCHSLDGTPLAGPTWQGLYLREEMLTDGTTVVADEEYIVQSILAPNSQIVAGFNPGVMPQNFEERFDETAASIAASQGFEPDITADLIAFIETLE